MAPAQPEGLRRLPPRQRARDRPGDVEAAGATVAEVLADLDRRFPGVRFRIVDEQDQVRQHMRIYIGPEPAATLEQRIPADQEIHILQALSG